MSAIRRIFQSLGLQDSMTQSYINRMVTKPSVAQIQNINQFIVEAKSILLKADVCYLLGAHDTDIVSSLKNIVSNNFNGSIGGTGLVYDTFCGIKNPSGTGWVNTNFTPSINATNYKLNDAGMSVCKYDSTNTTAYVVSAAGTTAHLRLLNTDYVINDATNRTIASVPFYNGLFSIRRTNATQKTALNQNIVNQVDTQNSVALPDAPVILFRLNAATTGFQYLNGINFLYIGAALTDAEHVILNNAVNDFLIRSLFIKYGENNWGVKMARSYFLDLHNFEKYEAWEVKEFIERHQDIYNSYPQPELSVNSGVAGMTDWIDSNADGLADGWYGGGFAGLWSIVTGNGFVGNAQRVIENNVNDLAYLGFISLTLNAGVSYKISGKYRCNTITKINHTTSGLMLSLPINTGNALPFDITFTPTSNGALYILSTAVSGAWFEIDEVSIKPIRDNYTPEVSLNSGAPGLTDWVDANADGLADNWSVTFNATYPSLASIVTGNGFTGNAQRSIENNANHIAHIACNSVVLVVGKTYVITGKYRASGNLKLNPAQGAIITWPSNTGNAIPFSATFTCTLASCPTFYSTVGASGEWLELDEVSLKEVSESDTINFNKALNGGFGLATDFVDSNADGLADGWEAGQGVLQMNTIVTGNGFTKRAQRAIRVNTTGNIYVNQSTIPLVVGRNYTVYLKYRSNKTLKFFGFDTVNSTTSDIGVINTGNAIEYSLTFTAVKTGFGIGYVGNSAQAGDWFEVSEILIIDNSNTQFYHNVFGPNGLNVTKADYLMLFKAGGNLAANTWAKTGALLRWNQDGGLTNSNTMPACTRGTNKGIVTVSSADGFSNLTSITMIQTISSVNSFYGNMPMLEKLKTVGKLLINGYYNRYKQKLIGSDFKRWCNGIYSPNISYPGGIKLTIADIVGGSYSSIAVDTALINSYGSFTGDATLITNEVYSQLYLGYNLGLYGTLRNVSTPDTLINVSFINTSITEAFYTWNRNIASCIFSGSPLPAAEVERFLKMIDDTYTPAYLPIKNLTLNLGTAPIGIATAQAQTYRNSIVAKFAAAAFTATITLRSS